MARTSESPHIELTTELMITPFVRTAHPSICTAKAIRNYFLNGDVPVSGTMCHPECVITYYLYCPPSNSWRLFRPGFIFPDTSSNYNRLSSIADEDQALARLWRELGEVAHPTLASVPFI